MVMIVPRRHYLRAMGIPILRVNLTRPVVMSFLWPPIFRGGPDDTGPASAHTEFSWTTAYGTTSQLEGLSPYLV